MLFRSAFHSEGRPYTGSATVWEAPARPSAPIPRPGFATRLTTPPANNGTSPTRRPDYYVSWSNHLDKDATLVRQAQTEAARRGDPPTRRLDPAWRRQAEDVLWALVNSPEFLYH